MLPCCCLQEFLRAHNAAAAEAQASAAAAAATAEAEAAAAAAGATANGPLSLWHEMQQRQQAEAAARESEVSVGPGLQGPGGMLGDDLWMFDGGLFAEEGVLRMGSLLHTGSTSWSWLLLSLSRAAQLDACISYLVACSKIARNMHKIVVAAGLTCCLFLACAGEPSFAVPSLNSQQQGPKGRRQGAKTSNLRPDVSPEPLYRLATSPHTPSMMDKVRTLTAAGKSPKVSTPGKPPAGSAAAAAGGLKGAAAAAAASGVTLPVQQKQAQATGAAGSKAVGPTEQQQHAQQQEQEPQRQDEDTLQQEEQQEGAAAGGRAGGLKLLLSASHSCSFSNLPRGLQQLLNSGDGTHKRRKSRHKHKTSQPDQPQQVQEQQQQATQGQDKALQAANRVESLVFGDIDSSVYRRLSSDAAGGPRHGTARAGAAATTGAAGPTDAAGSESGSESDSGSSESSSRRVSATGASDKQRRVSEGTDTAGEEEGPSLRSQLLLGHLLLLASNAVSGSAGAAAGAVPGTLSSSTAGATDSTVDTVSTAAPGSVLGLQGVGSSSSSVSLQPAGLQVLARHLRRSGLLPKWVYWLLRQLPQRPELYKRAFNRLFQQVRRQPSAPQGANRTCVAGATVTITGLSVVCAAPASATTFLCCSAAPASAMTILCCSAPERNKCVLPVCLCRRFWTAALQRTQACQRSSRTPARS